MTSRQVENIKERIESALNDKSYTVALMELEGMIGAVGGGASASDRLLELNRNYSYLKQYALDGVDDPMRNALLQEIIEGIKSLSAAVLREFEAKDNPSLYFGTLRFERSRESLSTAQLLEKYLKLVSNLSLAGLYGKGSTPLQRKELEETEQRIFNRIWVTHPLSQTDLKAIASALVSESTPSSFKRLLISAILLGGLEYFQAERITLLADAYSHNQQPDDIRALVALMLIMWHWHTHPVPSKIQARLEALTDSPDWNADLRTVYLQFLRARDTDRITRKMNEELIPKMMKLRPDMEKLQSMQDFAMEDFGEINPEWAERLRESGLEDELKALNDLQMEGADVMMSTFAPLKNFPFFHDVVNWFRDFNANNSSLNTIEGLRTSGLGQIIESMPGLCDSDRYSLALSMDKMPEQARKMMLKQLNAQQIDFAELAANKDADASRDTVANLYVQDLNRFFKLFRRRGEFKNPLASPVNLFELPLVNKSVTDTSLLELVSEFYMQRGYYEEALTALNLMLKSMPPSASLFQKAGYCLEKTGQTAKAIEAYKNSQLLDSANRWTMRRLAWCLRLTGQYNDAEQQLRQLLDFDPSDYNLTFQLGTCLMNTGRLQEALNCFFKLEFIDPKSTKSLRPIAWCAFLTGDYQRAEKYFNRIADDKPTADDHLNHGHLLMAQRRYRDAVTAYTACLEAVGRDMNKLRSMIDADRKHLENAKVDPVILSLVLDQVNNVLWT